MIAVSSINRIVGIRIAGCTTITTPPGSAIAAAEETLTAVHIFHLVICDVQIINLGAISAAAVDTKNRLVSTVHEKVIAWEACIVVKHDVSI